MQKIIPKILLRIAAIIMLLHSIGHIAGFSSWQKPEGTVPPDLVRKMQETHFLVQGRDTTMADSFSGSGYTVSVFLLLTVCILWTFSARADKSASNALLLTGFALILLALDELIFFFPAVATLSLTASLLVFISLYRMRKAMA